MSAKKVIVTAIVLAAAAAIVFAARSSRAPEPAPAEVDKGVSAPRALEGRATCLPHRDQSGPQTLECALGLKTDAGTFYALDGSGLEPGALVTLNESERVRVGGLTVPIEAVSSDAWFRYDIVGIMRVESVEKLK